MSKSNYEDLEECLKEVEQALMSAVEIQEDQKRTIEALMMGVEEAIGKEGTTPVLRFIAHLEEELAQAKKRIHSAYEIYAGMDGFIPETAPEGYCLRIIEQMADELKGKK